MRKLTLGLAHAALVVAVMVAWATPRPLGDLYIALAAGRDVLAGRLAGPDTWAFTSEGRTWVNPSWLSGGLLFVVERAGGETGLLVLKAALLAGLAWLLVTVSRIRGASLPAALVAAALALGASPQDFMLRPNLVSLLFVPSLLWLLVAPIGSGPRVWGTLALFGLWANVHGGFVFGLLVLALWTVARTRDGRDPGGEPRRSDRIGFLLLPGALAVTAFANPYGWENLAEQFSDPRSEAWKTVTEWRPMLGPRLPGVAFPWLFLVTAGFVFAAAVWSRIPGRRRGGRSREQGPNWVLFDAMLFLAVVGLSFSARRLVPWAAVAIAPLAALSVDRVLVSRRPAVLGTAVTVAVLLALTLPQRWLLHHYDPDNPLFPRESVFHRMILAGTHFPGGAARFLAENRVRARAFHEWRWEGYLRWAAPDIGLYLGGRAQQIYDETVAAEARELLGAPDPRRILARRDIALVVVPLTPEYGPLCQRLLSGETTWAYVYADRYTAVFADLASPATRDLVREAAAGRLVYPDSASAAAGRGLCLASPSVAAPPGDSVGFLKQAQAEKTAGWLYPILVSRALAAKEDPREVFGYLEGEWGRLLADDTRAPEGNAILEARLFLGAEIQRFLAPEAQEPRRRVAEGMEEARARIREIGSAYPAYYRAEPPRTPSARAPGPRG